ncbi:acidic leucine-rich nuclear phosphoprotein 32 family member A-like [Cucumis melo var. makuwa]|uniref:Acidic leucine-rich nuclear phosphoprotein 32 family member A-like n=1 Tax=Cucumis melo var. makuwa TaxID=1194695 RepID=A0A5A7VEP6_CUCMM|nr:acidic leucine-rich nuclear phosphoprotein 32 family member A-like [Cucumis melo var. makuwa]TYK15515.1 acidic leucine-rich nuclear phosphoprotein 32 family member A-like [Cucumis melo var. makuwa]
MGRGVRLFKSRWFGTNKNKNHRTHVKLGYKSINKSNFLFPKEPVILAIKAYQVYYIDDPKNGANWKVLLVVQNKSTWVITEVDDVEDQQLNVLEIVVKHRVDEHIEDDTLCRLDVDPTIVERPIVRHVVDNFIYDG